MRLSRQYIFYFFYEEISTYTLKTQGYLYIFYASSCFFKDLRTNIKNKVPQERLFTCRLSI